jgi:hypothetical protein
MSAVRSKSPGPVGLCANAYSAAALSDKATAVTFSICRNTDGINATLGTFTMSCPGVFDTFTGVTLELRRGAYDLGIGKNRKPYPIPAGVYEGRHTRDRFKHFMLEVFNVPGFEGIQVHAGNYPWHTHGCILAGTSVRLKAGVKSDLVKPLTSPVKQTSKERWDISVAAGLITAAPGSTFGISHSISGSGTALKQMKLRHAKAQKHFGAENVVYRVVVSDVPEPPVFPTIPPFESSMSGPPYLPSVWL